MRTDLLLAAGLCLLGIFTGMCSQQNQGLQRGQPEEQGIPPAVQFVGANSAIDQERHVLVRDEQDWEKLWVAHSPGEKDRVVRHAAPKIDFARYMVVGVFAGATTNTDGVVAKEVIEIKEGATTVVRIRFERSTFQTASMKPDGEQGMMTRPYGLWVVPKSDLAVVLEQGSMQLKGAEVQWREVKRFEVGL